MLLVGFPALALIVWQASGAQRVEAMKAKIRARGEPLSRQDFEAFYAVPKGREDVTSLWLAAFEGLSGETLDGSPGDFSMVGTGTYEIPRPGQPWPERAAAEAILAKYRANAEGLHEAARRGGAARYPLPFEHMSLTLLFRMNSLSGGAKLLILESHVRAHQGRPHDVAESIRTLNRLAESLQNEPMHGSQFARIDLGGMSASLCCRMLSDVDFSDEDLQRLADDYRTIRYDDGLYRALLVERALGISLFENPALWSEFQQESDLPGIWLTYNDDLALYLDIMERYIAGSRKPYHQASQDFQAIASRIPSDQRWGVDRFRYLRTLLLRPLLASHGPQTGRGNAQNEAATTAIAIERYRRRYGRVPERLGQLVPDFLTHLPIDPFDGTALRYVLQRDWYLLYSVGEDRVDNGGRGESEPDIVFAVRRRESR
jgi:hypothetical protein